MRSLELLGKRLVFPSDDSEPPELLLVCGPCRSGTTALSHNFILAGVESHMQPMKSILREQADGVDTIPSEIPFQDPDLVLIKETFGAEDAIELFNPVRLLVEAGYPLEKIKVIGMVREPVATFNSWFRLWGETHTKVFEGAFRLMEELQRYCAQYGVTYLPYVPEVIRDNDSAEVLRRVVEELGLSVDVSGAIDWNSKPPFGNDPEAWPRLYFYDAPPERFIAGVRGWGGFKYRDTVTAQHEVPDLATTVYDDHRKRCEEALGLTV